MRIQFVYSAALATVATIVAVDMTVQQLASASQEVKNETPSLLSKSSATSAPVVFARYSKSDPATPKQAVPDAVHCISDVFSAETDVCAVTPALTTAKTANTALPKWRLTKMPIKFLWQQEVSDSRRLIVELSDSSGPIKGKIETFHNGLKQSVLMTPELDKVPDELFLSAKLLDKDGKRVENWLLPIAIGEPE